MMVTLRERKKVQILGESKSLKRWKLNQLKNITVNCFPGVNKIQCTTICLKSNCSYDYDQ